MANDRLANRLRSRKAENPFGHDDRTADATLEGRIDGPIGYFTGMEISERKEGRRETLTSGTTEAERGNVSGEDARYGAEEASFGEMDERAQSAARRIVPGLSSAKYKGQDGRIGIFGGSCEYTGAPYFAATSALRTGADLVHVFCARDAGTALKSFCPDVIVHPILDERDANKRIRPWLERLHVVVVGPGLGREERVLKTTAELIVACRDLKKPMIIDADGLYLISQKPDLAKDYPGLILTPNATEFARLAKAFLDKSVQPSSLARVSDVKHLADVVGKNVVIVHKGAKDVIADGHKGTETISCGTSGSGRRCGGQGDVLAGALAVFWWWATSAGPSECAPLSPAMTAAYAAARLTRECNAAAFKIKRRGTLTSDMLEQIQPVFERLFETSAPAK